MGSLHVMDDREQLCNRIITLVADGMIAAEILTKEQAEEFCANHAIVFQCKGWWNRLAAKLWGEPSKDNEYTVKIVKIVA